MFVVFCFPLIPADAGIQCFGINAHG